MKFYVPCLGDRIRLLSSWSFKLYREYRNEDFYCSLFDFKGKDWLEKKKLFTILKENPSSLEFNEYVKLNKHIDLNKNNYIDITLPEGLILTIQRIYIRKGKKDYNSITFSAPKEFNKQFKGVYGRFWASLSDVNRLDFEKFISNKNIWIKSVNEETEDDLVFLEL